MKLSLLFRKRWLWLYLPVLLLSALCLWLSFTFWLPLPPRSVTIAGGLPSGSYSATALRYRDLLETRGIRADIVTTEGVSDVLNRLMLPQGNVQAGFVQGLLASGNQQGLSALAVVERQPVWILARNPRIGQLADLKNMRLGTAAAGNPGKEVIELILAHAQLKAGDIAVTEHSSNAAAATALLDGKMDALMLVASGESDTVRQLSRDPAVQIVGIDRVASFVARESRLKPFVLPQGAIELRGDIPSRDLAMVATNLHLLVRNTMHPALQRALLDVARDIHEMPSFLQRQGEFPNSRDMDFTASPTALDLANGERPWVELLLPYWWAQLAELLALAVIPILLITALVLVWIPSFFNWRINAILQNFYGELKFLETDIEPTATERPIEIKKLLQRLDDIEAKVTLLDLPNSYANRWYTLRQHLARAREKLLDMRAR